MRVLIIGAGSVGANIAYRVAQRGHETTVVDTGAPAQQTTGTSISWLSSFPQVSNAPAHDVPLRKHTNQSFRDLQHEIGGDWLHWTGTLTWSTDTACQEQLRLDQKRALELGVRVDVLTGAEARQLDDALSLPAGLEVFHEPDSGWVDAPLLVEALLKRATDLGATVRTHTRVAQIRCSGGAVAGINTDAGESIEADVVVNAAGSQAAHVAALAGCAIPLDLRPGLVVYARLPDHGQLGHVLDSPSMNIRPQPGGQVAIHWRGEPLYGHHSFNATDARSVVAGAARWLPALEGADPTAYGIGIRPIPPGGPIVGEHPDLRGFYTAVSHGGIGWGPQWGVLVAQELDGKPSPKLAEKRPDRFLLDPRTHPE